MGHSALLFVAGALSEYFVSAQSRLLAPKRPRRILLMLYTFLGWAVYAFVVGEFVVDRLNVLPFAIGAAFGALGATFLKRD